MYRKNLLKEKLARGETAYGLIHALGNSAVAEMMGQAGYDFVLIDGEHGLGDRGSLLACLQAVASTPATALYRVPANDPVAIKQALDIGIEAIMIPNVSTKAEAEQAVAACHYGPRGFRGFSAGTVRASDYGLNVQRYLGDDGRELLIVLMIESAEGARNAREIAAVDGVDVIQIGPFDLAFDLGIGARIDAPELATAMDDIEEAARTAGKPLGGAPLPVLPVDQMIERGYRLVTLSADTMLLMQGMAAALPEELKTNSIGQSQGRTKS
jgi:4-hydroxy-2-oxoheptanedioate aldolase